MKAAMMGNLLLEDIEYKVEQSRLGRWRRYVYVDGSSYHEFTSNARVFGMPFFHYTCGKNPETGRRVVARGVIAVGRVACGVLAIGQASFGLIAIGQLAVGVALGFGQFAAGTLAVGQVAIAALIGLGQLATGYVAIGQIAIGKYALGQIGIGQYVWSVKYKNPAAMEFFRKLPGLRWLLP